MKKMKKKVISHGKWNLFNKIYMKRGIMKKNFRRDILESYRKVSLEILKKYGDKVTVVERNE